MSINHEQVLKMAHLARLELGPSEIAPMQAKLNGIFSLIEAMQAVDTAGVRPMSHPHDGFAPLREDLPTEPDVREKSQSVAPLVERGLYLVPQVIE